jgi:hypothetical protein
MGYPENSQILEFDLEGYGLCVVVGEFEAFEYSFIEILYYRKLYLHKEDSLKFQGKVKSYISQGFHSIGLLLVDDDQIINKCNVVLSLFLFLDFRMGLEQGLRIFYLLEQVKRDRFQKREEDFVLELHVSPLF